MKQKFSVLFSSDILRSNEILAELDDYSYTRTRALYVDGERTTEEITN